MGVLIKRPGLERFGLTASHKWKVEIRELESAEKWVNFYFQMLDEENYYDVLIKGFLNSVERFILEVKNWYLDSWPENCILEFVKKGRPEITSSKNRPHWMIWINYWDKVIICEIRPAMNLLQNRLHALIRLTINCWNRSEDLFISSPIRQRPLLTRTLTRLPTRVVICVCE